MTLGSQISHQMAAVIFSNPEVVETVQLKRTAEGDYNNFGEWVPGAETTTDTIVVTEPMNGQDRQQLEEGLREADARSFYTQAAASAIQAGISGGDTIEYGGETWQVVRIRDWGGYRQLFAVVPEDCPDDTTEGDDD